jgi:hypothetical protein
MNVMSSSLGFWSVDPAAGALTCCPIAIDILGISQSHSRVLHDVLSRIIGGAGYEVGHRDAHMHGFVEQLAQEDRSPD